MRLDAHVLSLPTRELDESLNLSPAAETGTDCPSSGEFLKAPDTVAVETAEVRD